MTVGTLEITNGHTLLNDADFHQEILHNNSPVSAIGGLTSIELSPGDTVSIHVRGTSRSSPAGVGAATGSLGLNLTLIDGLLAPGAKFSIIYQALVNATGVDAFATASWISECYQAMLCERSGSPSTPESHTALITSDVLFGNTMNIDGNRQDTGRTGGDELLLDDVDGSLILASAQGVTSSWYGAADISANAISSTALSEFTITIAVVPLPPAFLLMAFGLAMLGPGVLRAQRRLH